MTAEVWQVHPAGDQMEAHGVRYRVRVSPGRGWAASAALARRAARLWALCRTREAARLQCEAWAAEDFVRQRQLDLPIEQAQAEAACP